MERYLSMLCMINDEASNVIFLLCSGLMLDIVSVTVCNVNISK